jgi:ADP-glucose pyrophosphorylase
VAPGAHVERSVVWPGARIERGASVVECIVAGGVTVPAGARYNRAVIAPGSPDAGALTVTGIDGKDRT